MGSKRAYTQVSVVRMFEDTPNLSQQAVMEAIVSGRSISNSITMSSMQGPYRSLERMNRYGRSGNYAYGLADVSSSLDNPVYGDVVWVDFLEDQHTLTNVAGTKDYIFLDDYYSLGAGDTSSRSMRVAFEEQTNPIVSPNTFAYYVDEATYTEIWANDGTVDYLHSTVPVDTLTSIEHYAEYSIKRMETTYDGDGNVDTRTTTTLGSYVWVYNESEGTIPSLHTVESTPISESIYPIVPIRVNGTDYADDGSGLDTSSDIAKMLGYLSIDPADIVDSIKENEDEDAIDDVFIGFGISAAETEEWAIAGLAHTFSTFHTYNPASETIFTTSGDRQNIIIEEAGFKNNITYNFIRSEIKSGTPGYTKSFTEGNPIEECLANPYYDPDDSQSKEETCTVVGSTNEYVFTRPIVGTSTYEEITVQGLTSTHTMEVPGFGERVTQFLGNGDELTVPLIKEVLKSIPIRLRDDLIFGSLHLYIYSYDIIKLKWYERGIFKALITVIGIALSIFTYGSTLASAFGASTLAGAIVIAQILAVTLLVDYAVQWLVEEVGGALALILSLTLSLVTANFSTMSVSINTSWYSLFSAAVKVHGTYVNSKLEEITEDQAAFDDEYEDRQEQLDSAYDLLDWGTPIDLLGLSDYRSQPNYIEGETEQEFYDRTTSIVDLPEISNNMVTLYYEAQLELPKVDPFSMNPQYNRGI